MQIKKNSLRILRKDVYDRFPAHKVKIILGNFNAKLWLGLIFGPTIAYTDRHETSSNNGLKLIDFDTARKMVPWLPPVQRTRN